MINLKSWLVNILQYFDTRLIFAEARFQVHKFGSDAPKYFEIGLVYGPPEKSDVNEVVLDLINLFTKYPGEETGPQFKIILDHIPPLDTFHKPVIDPNQNYYLNYADITHAYDFRNKLKATRGTSDPFELFQMDLNDPSWILQPPFVSIEHTWIYLLACEMKLQTLADIL